MWIAIGLMLFAILVFALAGLVAPSKAHGNGAYCGAHITQDLTLQHVVNGCVDAASPSRSGA